jgi:hypothetical protein
MDTNKADDTSPNKIPQPFMPNNGQTGPIPVPMGSEGTMPISVPMGTDETIPIPVPVAPEPAQSANSLDFTQTFSTGNLPQQFPVDKPQPISSPIPPIHPLCEPPVLQPAPPRVKKPHKPRRWIWILLGLFIVLILGSLGSYLGYANAVYQRLEKQNSQIVITAMEQFQLGLQDEAAGRWEVARKRFEYVIQLDPGFPGAPDKLMEVMLQIATISVPTPVPTQRITPTPDTRGKEGMFASAQGYLRNSQWNDAIQSLEWLRKEDINYHPVEVDGLLYVALRNRGIEKIQSAQLEGGTYDLALAEKFAPLDKDAEGFRNAARFYLIGRSFWLLDWPQAIEYFGQIASMGLVDVSGVSAAERYRVALKSYGDQLAEAGDACGA